LKKDVLSIFDLSSEDILSILDLAVILKNQFKTEGSNPKILRGQILGMIFQKPSTRTRISFESAMLHLGGHAVNLSFNDLQLSRGESIEDTARTFSLYVNCIMARVYSHDDVEKLSRHSTVPVINGLSDLFHPCQILADLLTIMEFKKKLKGLTLSFVGDGNNVCNDLLLCCSKLGIDIRVCTPEEYPPLNSVIEFAKKESERNNSTVLLTVNPIDAVSDSDVVITDTFTSIGKENEKDNRERVFLPRYQINGDLVKFAKEDYLFMHCLPANRGKEVTSEIIDGPNSVIWHEAENRLHVQKALLLKLLDNQISHW
jgi:ornithine carbamoyltransferase